ncbi:hypothetical protein KR059_005639 [Drosophila kikkawai]|nr:hypothetical protein KR059_005639 [Drosophila kikkawai]
MTAFNQDQRFALLLIISLVGGSCLLDFTKAQTLTAEDRLSVLKFVGAFMNFLDLELENSTMATPESTSTTPTSVETTTLTSDNNSTDVTTEVTSNSTTTIEETSSSTSATTEPETSTTTEATTTTVRRRMCFKRFCYKFGGDKGYIV